MINGVPPVKEPSFSFFLYITERLDSIKAVAEPSIATSHIQNIEPGPPTDIAATTPAIFPAPTLQAVPKKNVSNELIPCLPFSFLNKTFIIL